MKILAVLGRRLLALGFVTGLSHAAIATSPFGPSVATAGVICSPGFDPIVVSKTTKASTPVEASCGYHGQFATSSAWAKEQSIYLSGDAQDGAITGAPSAVDDLLGLVTPPGVPTIPGRRHHSWVRLGINTTHVDDPALGRVLMTFNVHGEVSDSGAALHFRIWEEWPRHMYIVDEIRGGERFGGRMSFQEVYFAEGVDILDYRVEGLVLATSQTPEPGTALLAGVALVIAGCCRLFAA